MILLAEGGVQRILSGLTLFHAPCSLDLALSANKYQCEFKQLLGWF